MLDEEKKLLEILNDDSLNNKKRKEVRLLEPLLFYLTILREFQLCSKTKS